MSETLKLDEDKLHLACSCGSVNAVPLEKLQKGPVCGACKQNLNPPDQPVEATDANFNDLVEKSPLPVMVDFWAPWCAPCRMMGPILESFAKKRAGQVLVAKFNTDDSPNVPGKFGIQGIPTLIVFKAGKETNRQVGAVPEAALEKLIG